VNLIGQLRNELEAMEDVVVYTRQILGIDWLFERQWKVLKEFYNKSPDTGRMIFKDMVLCWGMRSGKTTEASIIATYEGFKLIQMGTPCAHYGLPAGTEIFIINVATSDRQAKDTVFAHIKARFEYSRWWKNQKKIERHNEIVFPVQDGKIIFRSEHSNSASLAGKNVICSVFDEMARFKQTGGVASAEMVYDTLSRGAKTFKKDGKRIAISSPVLVDDFFYGELYMKGKNEPQVYVDHGATWEVNDTIGMEDLEDEFRRNPETAMRDYGAIPSHAIERYFREFNRIELLERGTPNPRVTFAEHKLEDNSIEMLCDIKNVDGTDWKGQQGIIYHSAGDPAVKNDVFGFALGHKSPTGMLMCDLIFTFGHDDMGKDNDGKQIKEVDARKVKALVLELRKRCLLACFVTDIWNFPETLQEIRRNGIEVRQNTVGKREYDHFKEKGYLGEVDLPTNALVLHEFENLEVINQTKVEHPRTGSKDTSDAVVNMFYSFQEKSKAIREEPVAVSVVVV